MSKMSVFNENLVHYSIRYTTSIIILLLDDEIKMYSNIFISYCQGDVNQSNNYGGGALNERVPLRSMIYKQRVYYY